MLDYLQLAFRWLLFAIIFAQMQGQEAGVDQEDQPCFRVLYPENGHILSSTDEHKSLTFLFRINCPGILQTFTSFLKTTQEMPR
jgi:hypothetical protein